MKYFTLLFITIISLIQNINAQRTLFCTSTYYRFSNVGVSHCIGGTSSTNYEGIRRCTEKDALGQHETPFTVDWDTTPLCVTAVQRVQDQSGENETLVYRAALLSSLELGRSCEEYCDTLRNQASFLESMGIKVTIAYVGCWKAGTDGNATNIENLDHIIMNQTSTKFNCATNVSYANEKTDPNDWEKPPSAPPSPTPAPPVRPTTVPVIWITGDSSIPGWYYISIGTQVVVLVVSFITILLFVIIATIKRRRYYR